MAYDVRIKQNATGEVRTYNMDADWHGASHFWWTDGNFGCDCNRSMSFMRAGGATEDEVEAAEHPCGHELYTAIDATLADGQVIPLDPVKP